MKHFAAGLSAAFVLTAGSAGAATPTVTVYSLKVFLIEATEDATTLLDASVVKPAKDLAQAQLAIVLPAGADGSPGMMMRMHAEFDCAGARIRPLRAVIEDQAFKVLKDEAPTGADAEWKPMDDEPGMFHAAYAYACRDEMEGLRPLPATDLHAAATAIWAR